MRVASATSPRGQVTLVRRADALELRVNGVFVMDTAQTTTERALARAALAQVNHPEQVLVGGLGLGFTAAEMLTDERVTRLEVVEIEPAVVSWLADGSVPHGPALLADPRLHVIEADVASYVAALPPASVDALVLDVDNGPGYLVHEGNSRLYQPQMLGTIARVLRPGGAVVIWSSARAPELATAMAAVLDESDEQALAVQLQRRDEQYWLYSGWKDEGQISGSHGTGSAPAG
ncbi:spermidine synthase [Ruania albidiflava]|uniref:spermidine synthase n=1 Tax=Ruania albidiflava TaxID=366586 RepID=UPI0023F38CA8|nr:hypothetical protein [Ruania albidiflava]